MSTPRRRIARSRSRQLSTTPLCEIRSTRTGISFAGWQPAGLAMGQKRGGALRAPPGEGAQSQRRQVPASRSSPSQAEVYGMMSRPTRCPRHLQESRNVQFRDFLVVLRTRWRTDAACALLVLGATAAYTLTLTP